MTPFCAAVDWGTTNFRLWLLAADGTQLAERTSDEGAASLTASGFPTVLDAHLGAIGAPADLRVVICGMAGSRSGWKEATYLRTPVDPTGVADQACIITRGGRDIRILPGIAQYDPSHPDVMRGEETQIAGALALGHGDGRYCLPGTHSKWIDVEDRKVTGFQTCMTGELFALLTSQSTLRQPPDVDTSDGLDPHCPAFRDALREAFDAPDQVMARLFGIRAGPLLGLIPQHDTVARLSGLLIGAELALMSKGNRDKTAIRLIADGQMRRAYGPAIAAMMTPPQTLHADELTCAGLLAAAHQIWSPVGATR